MFRLEKLKTGNNSVYSEEVEITAYTSVCLIKGHVHQELLERPTVGWQLCFLEVLHPGVLDYFHTSKVSEILEESPTRVVFRTMSGSEYVWEKLL